MSWENSFKGKSVLVTGAGQGIGRALVKKFDSLGCVVYAVSKSPEKLASLKSECQQVETVQVDLSDWKTTRSAIEKIGVVDCLINNAAVILSGQFRDISSEDLDSMFNVNLKAVVNVSQVVSAKMIEAGKGGSIVHISSAAGQKAMTYVTAYGVLKAALNHLTKMMAVELGPHNIRVNSVSPGGVNTGKTEEDVKDFLARINPERIQEAFGSIPLNNKIVEMNEVIHAVMFCLSDSVPNVTGSIIPLDGGYTAN